MIKIFKTKDEIPEWYSGKIVYFMFNNEDYYQMILYLEKYNSSRRFLRTQSSYVEFGSGYCEADPA